MIILRSQVHRVVFFFKEFQNRLYFQGTGLCSLLGSSLSWAGLQVCRESRQGGWGDKAGGGGIQLFVGEVPGRGWSPLPPCPSEWAGAWVCPVPLHSAGTF